MSMAPDLHRTERRLAVSFLTAVARAGALATVALLPLRSFGAGGWRPDAVLIVAVALAALVAWLLSRLLRRRAFRVNGTGMVVGLLVVAVLLVLCVQRTGALTSPLLLLVAALVGTAGMILAPVPHFLHLAGVCLAYTVMALLWAKHVDDGVPPHVLIVHLGLLTLLGFGVNVLACRIREQREELTGLAMRDPTTGTLRRSFFHARLVSLIESVRGGLGAVEVLVFDLDDLDDDELLHDAGAILNQAVREGDLVARVGPARFAVAMVTDGGGHAESIAPRLARRIEAGTSHPVFAAFSRLPAEKLEADPIQAARRLFTHAESSLSTVPSTVPRTTSA